MKKLISLLLLLTFTCGMLTACGEPNSTKTESAETDETVFSIEDLTWENTDGGIEITNYSGSATVIEIPETIANKKVVSVGNAFSGNVIVESITLPKSCTEGNFAGCESLTYLSFPGYTDLYTTVFPENIQTLIVPNFEPEIIISALWLALRNFGN